MKEYIYDFCGINSQLFLIINNYINNYAVIPTLLKIISRLFSVSSIFILYIFFLCLFIYKAFFFLKNNLIAKFNFQYFFLVKFGIMYSIFIIIYTVLKFNINFPRPYCSLPIEQIHTIANLASERCLSSFPSAHAGISLLIINYLWPYMNFLYKIIGIFIIFLVSISRIALAMHYPADILYGYLFTIPVIYFTDRLLTLSIVNLFLNTIHQEIYEKLKHLNY